MNIGATQNYTENQIQNTTSSKTESKEDFLAALQEFESTKTQTSKTGEIVDKELDEKYKLGLQRYNTMGAGDDKWFKDSIFEKDQGAKDEFIEYLADLSVRDYMMLSAKLWSSFGSGLMEDENGNIVPGNHEKNPAVEFKTLQSTKNYFEDEIYKLEEGARKFGGDPSKMIEFLTEILNLFKDYQSNQQEKQYKSFSEWYL